MTLWDVCHRNQPEFPEVRCFHEFHIRESPYKKYLAPAALVLTDSNQLTDRASKYYGIDRSRFLAMPFAPSPFLDQEQVRSKATVLLIPNKDKDWKPTVVFSGKDCGNLSYVKKFVEENESGSQVKLLGFVPFDEVRGLYEGALAIVMPTYFGPTSLPRLRPGQWLSH